MRINEASKFVPNSFYKNSQESEYYQKRAVSNPFKSIDNLQDKGSKKSNRKGKLPKKFLEDEEGEDGSKENDLPISPLVSRQEEDKQSMEQQMQQNLTIIPDSANKKQNFLLQLEIGQDSETEGENQKEIRPIEEEEIMSLPAFRNFDKLQLMEWSNSSENESQKNEEKRKSSKKAKQTKMVKEEPMVVTRPGLFESLPKGKTIQCMLRRDKQCASGSTEYNIYLKTNLNHIVTVRKEGLWKYCIYLREKGKGEEFFKYTKVATLESSFLGNKFTLIKEGEKYSNITICYQTNIFGLSGPRKFYTYVPNTPLPYEYLHDCYDEAKYHQKIQKCTSRTAKWNEKSKSYVLDFFGKATQSSIKNFIVTDLEEYDESNFIIFGKSGPDVYNLDIQFPYSLIQGIAVALTAFERKITCD